MHTQTKRLQHVVNLYYLALWPLRRAGSAPSTSFRAEPFLKRLRKVCVCVCGYASSPSPVG